MNSPPPAQIGKYRIERELGRGTMGVVYQAKDTTLGRTVALKTFGASAAMAAHEREAFEQRFLSEARISATLDDEHVVRVYDVGRDFESGLLYMALEFVRGETLADRLGRGALPWRDALRVVTKAARALDLAHRNQIVHRDIKPANIMMTASGEPKIMDFGIAKAAAAQLTMAGQVFGTPAYMSPEQASGQTVDGRSDVFSLGCVLYELITGIRPFEGPNMAATITKILHEEPKAPSALVADLPAGVDTIVARALRKNRDVRYRTAAVFADEMDALLADPEPKMAPPPPPKAGGAKALDIASLETATPLAGPPPTVARDTVRRETPPAGSSPPGGGEPARRSAPRPAAPPAKARETTPPPPAGHSRAILTAAVLLVTLGLAGAMLARSRGPSGPGVTPSPAATPADLASGTPTQAEGEDGAADPTGPPRPPETPATVVSIGPPGSPSRVALSVRHPFGSASLRVLADGRIVVATPIQGMPIRHDGVTTGFDGRFSTDFQLSPGAHVIQVEVRSGDAALVQSVRLSTPGGEGRRLSATVDGSRTLNLSFE